MQSHPSLASRVVPLRVLLFITLIGSAALSGCGQKGPLTLSKPPAGAASAPTK
jgi:predicted small lipoprotein YifL